MGGLFSSNRPQPNGYTRVTMNDPDVFQRTPLIMGEGKQIPLPLPPSFSFHPLQRGGLNLYSSWISNTYDPFTCCKPEKPSWDMQVKKRTGTYLEPNNNDNTL
jgi:hypothetical protein